MFIHRKRFLLLDKVDPEKGEAGEPQKTISIDEFQALKEQFNSLSDSNKTLIKDLESSNSKVKKFQDDDLSRKGEHESIITNLRADLATVTESSNSKDTLHRLSIAKSSAVAELTSLGCEHVSDVIALYAKDLKSLDVDLTTMSTNPKQIKDFGAKALSERSFFFKTQKPGTSDLNPSGASKDQSGTDSNYIDELQKCTSQAQIKSIKEKYNRS
jgi:hypothetical protein